MLCCTPKGGGGLHSWPRRAPPVAGSNPGWGAAQEATHPRLPVTSAVLSPPKINTNVKPWRLSSMSESEREGLGRSELSVRLSVWPTSSALPPPGVSLPPSSRGAVPWTDPPVTRSAQPAGTPRRGGTGGARDRCARGGRGRTRRFNKPPTRGRQGRAAGTATFRATAVNAFRCGWQVAVVPAGPLPGSGQAHAGPPPHSPSPTRGRRCGAPAPRRALRMRAPPQRGSPPDETTCICTLRALAGRRRAGACPVGTGVLLTRGP